MIETLERDGASFQERTLHYSLGEHNELYGSIAAGPATVDNARAKTLSIASSVSTGVSENNAAVPSPVEAEAGLADLNAQRELLLRSVSDLHVNEY